MHDAANVHLRVERLAGGNTVQASGDGCTAAAWARVASDRLDSSSSKLLE